MYVDHFKLKTRPFANGSDAVAFLSAPDTDIAVARLRDIMLAGNSAALLTGGPGVGKSTIIAEAMKPIADRVLVVDIDLRQTDPILIYQMVLLSLGAELGDGNVADSLHRVRQAIREINDSERQVTVVIDISGFTLQRAKHILQLSQLANRTGGQLNLILLGPHTLHRLLDTPGLIHIRQRIGFRFRLRPFTLEQTGQYIESQIEGAKGKSNTGKSKKLLDEGVAMTVYQYVGGVPRLIDTLMDASLSQASFQKLKTLTVDTIDEVAKDLGWKPLSRGQPAVTPGTKTTAKPEKPVLEPEKVAADPANTELELEKEDTQLAEPEVDKHDVDEEIFEQPLKVIPETEQSIHEGTSVTDARSETRTGEKDEPGELTQQLLIAAENLETTTKSSGSSEEPPSGIPEMNAEDTGATGMLRLEDLDARFAETVFGQDSAMLDAVKKLQKMKDDA